MTDSDFELRLPAALRELAEPAPAGLGARVNAIPDQATAWESRSRGTSWGRPAVMGFAALGLAAVAVAVVVLVAVGSLLRPPVVAPPTGPDSPTASPSVICEAFVAGGPMDDVALGFPHGGSDIQLGLLDDSVAGLLALAERASGDERGDVLAMATAVENMTTAYLELITAPQGPPQDPQDPLVHAAQDAFDAFVDAWPAFYLKYSEFCALELDAPTVDCGPLDQVTCDRRVAELIAGQRQRWEDGFHEGGLPSGLPVLGVVLGGSVDCISHTEIYWPGGGIVAESMCGDANPLPTPTAIVGSPEVGVPYQVIVHCTVDFPLGDTWWRFENAGPTPEPVFEDLRGSVPAIVTLTSPATAILHHAEGYERMLVRVDEPIEGSCVGV